MHTKARWIRAALLGQLGLILSVLGHGQELSVRVVDVGAGECVVVKAPGNGGKDHYMIYDAGNYEDKGRTAIEAIREIVPEGSLIDLLVLSHSDSDHLAAVPEIMDEYKVKRVIHPGYERPTATWRDANQAILDEVRLDGCKDLNLANVEIAPGSSYRIGRATAVFVAGFHKPPEEWGQLSDSEEKNAGSVIIRLIYKGKSILLCGDAVGRHIDDPADSCIAMEEYVVENTEAVKLDSDVIVAPHHGADNGSSQRFIAEVSPEYVIFAAGHKFDHPRKTAAERYLSAGVSIQMMFRTDREDDESKDGDKEWAAGRKAGEHDKPGDDDVVITVSASGVLTVKYLNP